MAEKIPCPSCKADNFPSSIVCWQCGKPLRETPQPGQTQQMPAQQYQQPQQTQQMPARAPSPAGQFPGNPSREYAAAPPERAPYPGYAAQGPVVMIPRPAYLTAMVIVAWVFGVFKVVYGAILASVVSKSMPSMVPGGMPPGMGSMFSIIPIFSTVFSLLFQGFVGFVNYRIWMGYVWARIVMIILTAIGVLSGLAGVASLATTPMTPMPVMPKLPGFVMHNVPLTVFSLLFSIAFLIILCLPKTGEYCKR